MQQSLHAEGESTEGGKKLIAVARGTVVFLPGSISHVNGFALSAHQHSIRSVLNIQSILSLMAQVYFWPRAPT
jgi:hypothetical protein